MGVRCVMVDTASQSKARLSRSGDVAAAIQGLGPGVYCRSWDSAGLSTDRLCVPGRVDGGRV